MLVRKANENDAGIIAEISVLTWKNTYKGLIADEILDKKQLTPDEVLKWKNRIKDPKDFFILVAEDENGVQGFLWGGAGRDERIPVEKEVYAFYVLPNQQGKGIGKALLKEFMRETKNSDFYAFVLQNNPSEAFYEKVGLVCNSQYLKIDGGLTENAFIYYNKKG